MNKWFRIILLARLITVWFRVVAARPGPLVTIYYYVLKLYTVAALSIMCHYVRLSHTPSRPAVGSLLIGECFFHSGDFTRLDKCLDSTAIAEPILISVKLALISGPSISLRYWHALDKFLDSTGPPKLLRHDLLLRLRPKGAGHLDAVRRPLFNYIIGSLY